MMSHNLAGDEVLAMASAVGIVAPAVLLQLVMGQWLESGASS